MTDENSILDIPRKGNKKAFVLMASLSMLGVELPSKRQSKKVDLPTRGMKGLSNAELRTSGKKRKHKRKRK